VHLLVVIKTVLSALLAKLTVTQAVKNSAAIKTAERFNGTLHQSLLVASCHESTEFNPNPSNLFL
jgi:hypothetical protein